MGVLMLRHTQPAIAPGICYGQTDLDVAESFEQEAAKVLANLPQIDEIRSSPLLRCHKLAAYIGARRGLELALDPDLIEMDFGTWEGLAWDAIPRAELDVWAADFYSARPHGGENVAQLQVRAKAALKRREPGTKTVLIVTHAGIIRSAFANGTEAQDFQTEIEFGGCLALPEQKENKP